MERASIHTEGQMKETQDVLCFSTTTSDGKSNIQSLGKRVMSLILS